MDSELTGAYPTLPGEILAEEIHARGMSVDDAAATLGWSVRHVMELIRGAIVVDEAIASQLDVALGVTAEMWLHLEARYQQWQERNSRAFVNSATVAGLAES